MKREEIELNSFALECKIKDTIKNIDEIVGILLYQKQQMADLQEKATSVKVAADYEGDIGLLNQMYSALESYIDTSAAYHIMNSVCSIKSAL